MSERFAFDINKKRHRLSDAELVDASQVAAEAAGNKYFTTIQYDGLGGRRPHSPTIIERFGTWKKALALVGVSGGRERQYSPEQLIVNLENSWRELGMPPGKKQIAKLAGRISERPYKNHWGSVRSACEALANFHEGKISREALLRGNVASLQRLTIPLKDRWFIPGDQNIDSWRGPLFSVMAGLDRATRRGTVPLRVARSEAGHDGQGASPWVNV